MVDTKTTKSINTHACRHHSFNHQSDRIPSRVMESFPPLPFRPSSLTQTVDHNNHRVSKAVNKNPECEYQKQTITKPKIQQPPAPRTSCRRLAAAQIHTSAISNFKREYKLISVSHQPPNELFARWNDGEKKTALQMLTRLALACGGAGEGAGHP